MSVTITLMNSDETEVLRKYKQPIDRQMSVAILKQKVASQCDGSIKSMKCNGHELDLNKTLASNGVQEGDEVRVTTDQRDVNINVMVQLMSASANNRPSYITCRPSNTTEEFVALVRRNPSLNVPDANYTCNGQTLRNGATLRAQNIGENSVVNIGVRMRGG